MDYNVVINLMKEMNNTNLTKLEIEEEGLRICLEKSNIPQAMVSIPVSNTVPSLQTDTVIQQEQTAGTQARESKLTEELGKRILSPMVGTYYSQPAPDKPPFVKAGDKVKKGQTLCIIEAMKLMNEIECEEDGEIVEVLVNNEDMVEYNQPMFILR